VNTRETTEVWPLLTVETEVNGDSRSTNLRGPSMVGSLGSLCRYKRFLYCLGCCIFFLALHYLSLLVPIAHQLGKQSRWLTCLLICVSGEYFSEHLRHLGQYLSHLKGELGGWVQRGLYYRIHDSFLSST
jgi:hypothetical protein